MLEDTVGKMFRWIAVKKHLLVAVFATITIVVGGDFGTHIVCGPDTSDETSSSLVFVSTLDGNLQAIDLNNGGQKKWSIEFNDKPMLSSSIHRRELNNEGHWVRLIPSLNGGLYKFDGENLEALPVTPQQLLRSSFRYSDDLVLSGSGETHTYGVSTSTGQILYHCHEGSCTNMTENESYIANDVLIVRRFQDTVRAAEPRTGQERWNYSVGQHELELIPNTNYKCNSKLLQRVQNIDLKVDVPKGILSAVDRRNPSQQLWNYTVSSPIVAVWREHGVRDDDDEKVKLESVNIFENSLWNWGSEFTVSPTIYVGMHDRQLYIQENVKHVNVIEHSHTGAVSKPPKIYPWRPYPASNTALVIHEEDTSISTALSVLYNSEFINGHGFYLHSRDQQEESNQCNKTHNILVLEKAAEPADEYTEEETPVQVMIVSLWYWWKEVVIISITTAILLNFMLTQRLLNATTVVKDAVMPPLIVERHIPSKEENNKVTPILENSAEFVSRYLTDFDPIDCLGKGGYGVVFEARKKIDYVNYAVKRITLPNSEDARERVMREVRALANLDHQNIVRYFHAWLECPPAGWKELHDDVYINKHKFSPSEFPSEVSLTPTKPNGSVCIDVPPSDKSSVDSAFEALELNNKKRESSFVIFDDYRSEDSAVTEEIYDSADNDSDSSGSISDKQYVSSNNEESESIVFKNTCSSEDIKRNEKSERDKRKASLSLNFNQKTSNKRAPRMFLYIQMQLCHRESLREWLKRQTQSRNIDNVENIFQQIVDGVEYVHLHGLIHRDLKPSNIFFSYDKKVKIGDFGLATAMTEGWEEPRTPNGGTELGGIKSGFHTAHVGTQLYMAPEQMNGQIYNYKVDIYSLGIILFELLTPFTTDMERMMALMNLRKSIFPNGFAEEHPKAYDLLKMMLDDNPAKRPTTLGIKARPPLSKTEWTIDDVTSDSGKWHFELPQISRHSSVNNSSSGESWDISTSQSHE